MLTLAPSMIAHRDSRRFAGVLREIGGEGAPVGGGWMACDIQGSWANFAAGLGLDGPVEGEELDALVAFYKDRGRQPQVQVTPYQHPTLMKGLTDRGFVGFENETVLVHALDDLPELGLPDGLQIRRVDPASEEDALAFCDSQMTGFFEDKDPPAGMLPITLRVVRHPRAMLWLLELHGEIVGSGGVEVFEESAVLIGGCVHRGARRQGIHSAFLRFRLAHAVSAGKRYAIVASLKGEATERNALRAGFTAAYTQARLKQP